MRKVIQLICVVLIISCLCSCGKDKNDFVYTQNNPFLTVNATEGMEHKAFTVTENAYVYRIPNILTFDEYIETKVNGDPQNPYAIMLVYVSYTESIWWDNGENDKGGYTVTHTDIIEIYNQNTQFQKHHKKLGSQICFLEPYTVDPDGEFLLPVYRHEWDENQEYRPYDRNPVMQYQKCYIVMVSGTNIFSDANRGEFKCYLTENDAKKDAKTVINKETSPLFRKIRECYFAPWLYIYEYSEEAYLRSKAIVEQYEREGKTREDGSYYLYHAMVVDAWERYGMEKDS